MYTHAVGEGRAVDGRVRVLHGEELATLGRGSKQWRQEQEDVDAWQTAFEACCMSSAE